MFFRAGDAGTGSGIGLYITKECVDKLRGDIKIESKQGYGTKFIVTIPNQQAVT